MSQLKYVKLKNINSLKQGMSFWLNCFNYLILQQNDDFKFVTRNRRPPTDKVNALLSFTYSILTRDCEAALEGVGFYYTG